MSSFNVFLAVLSESGCFLAGPMVSSVLRRRRPQRILMSSRYAGLGFSQG